MYFLVLLGRLDLDSRLNEQENSHAEKVREFGKCYYMQFLLPHMFQFRMKYNVHVEVGHQAFKNGVNILVKHFTLYHETVQF